jgi:uncharacterized protein (TIGR02118 family)
MIVRMGLLTRLPNLPVEQFRKHWRTVHGPLAARLPGLRAYHQNHIVDSEQLGISYPRGNWNIDGFSELWFDDRDAMRRAIASEAYAPIAADSDAFVSDTRVIVAEQQVVVPVPADAGPLIKRMSILTHSQGCDADRFRHEWWTVHAPMVQRFPELVGYTQNLIVDREGVPGASSARDAVPADGIVEMWFRDVAGLQAAFASDAAQEAQAHARDFIGEITTFLVETHRIV